MLRLREVYRLTASEEVTYDVVHRGVVVGYIVVAFDEERWRECRVHSVNLLPASRGKGLGVRLYRELARRIEAFGFVLCSDTDRSDAANQVWVKLCRTGYVRAEPRLRRFRFLTKAERAQLRTAT